MVTSDMLILMTVEILLGCQWGDARSRVPLTDENREAWEAISNGISEKEEAGLVVEIPFEIPDISDYVSDET